MFRDGISTIKILKQTEMKTFIMKLISSLDIEDTHRHKLYDYLKIKHSGGKKPLKKKPLKKKPLKKKPLKKKPLKKKPLKKKPRKFLNQ